MGSSHWGVFTDCEIPTGTYALCRLPSALLAAAESNVRLPVGAFTRSTHWRMAARAVGWETMSRIHLLIVLVIIPVFTESRNSARPTEGS